MYKDDPHKSIITEKGINIIYRYVQRTGPTVIILHGLGGDLESFELVEQYLPSNYSLLTIDQRGHGLSSRPHRQQDYAVEKYADDLHQIIKKEKINDYILIGHCFGGSIAQTYAKKYGQSIKGLMLITSQTHYQWWHKFLALNPIFYMFIKLWSLLPFLYWRPPGRLNNHIFIGTPDINPKLSLYNWYYTSLGSWSQGYLRAIAFNINKVKGKVKNCPVKVVSGKKDWLIPPIFQTDMSKVYQHVEQKKLNYGHMMPLNQPKVLAQEIDTFVSDVYRYKQE